MGAWNLTAGFVLFVVILNNVQPLIAVRAKLTKEQVDEDKRLHSDFQNCGVQWLPTLGEKCGANTFNFEESLAIIAAYEGGDSVKTYYQRLCRPNHICSEGKCKCADSSVDSSSCDDTSKLKQKNSESCDTEIKAYSRFLRGLHNSGKSVTDAGQHFQFIILMAVTIFFVAAN